MEWKEIVTKIEMEWNVMKRGMYLGLVATIAWHKEINNNNLCLTLFGTLIFPINLSYMIYLVPLGCPTNLIWLAQLSYSICLSYLD